MRKSIKAVAYVVGGFTVSGLSFLGILYMYFSTILPVYVGSTYVVGNQILRYMIYALLTGIGFLSVWVTSYGMKYLIKRFRKIKKA